MQWLAATDDEMGGRGIAVGLGDDQAMLGGASQELTLHPLADDFGRTAARHGWKSEGRSQKKINHRDTEAQRTYGKLERSTTKDTKEAQRVFHKVWRSKFARQLCKRKMPPSGGISFFFYLILSA